MYCIFHLPRTGSRYLHSLINTSLILLDPRHHGTNLEPFNTESVASRIISPKYENENDPYVKYEKLVNSVPPSTVKMVINHYPDLAERFIDNPDYKTIFIKPKNYRKRLLKALIEKHLNIYSNGTDRKEIREPFIGKLTFTDEYVTERFIHYKIHMEYEQRCDYVFYDEDIFTNPNNILETLNLPNVNAKYKRIAPYYSDEQMLVNVEDFNKQYDRISINLFGEII